MLPPMFGEAFARKRLGEVLDARYELTDLLGVGMTGAVYRALHKYTQREVAVKIMHQQLVSDDNAVARFLREAKSVAKIGHPAIVEVIDAGQTQDHWPYVVLELLHGRSLGALLKSGPLPAHQVIDIGADLLDGLIAAHGAGIVHRDLKPDNLFLLDNPEATRLKVLDFGVAKNLQSTGQSAVLTKPGATVGTPSYMSPEAATKGPIGPATDIYALGLIVYDMIVGQPAFRSGNPMRTLMAQVKQPAPRVSERVGDVPPELDDFVDALLRKDPATRPQDPMQIAKHLEQLRAVAPLAPDPTVPHVQTRFEAFGAETTEESAATTLWDRDHVRPSFTPPPQQPAPPMAAPPSPKRPSLLPFVLLAVAALFVGALTFALVWAARLWLG